METCLRINEILFLSKFYSNNDCWNTAINFKVQVNLTKTKSHLFYLTYHILKQILCYITFSVSQE